MRLAIALGRTARRWASALSLGVTLCLACPHPIWAQATPAEAPAGDLAEAEQLYQQSLKLRGAGRYAEAQPLAERALAIREKVLGPEHLDVATSLNGLGILYGEQGDYTGAKPRFERALAIREKALGPEHPDVALSLNSLGTLYTKRGDYTGAELLYKRAFAIREKALGPEHPYVALSLNNLATVYMERGDAGAEPLLKRALAIQEKALELDPDMAPGLNNLANLYLSRGDYAGAEPLFKRALAIREKALGPEHPDVASSLNNLAILYRDWGDYAGAELLFKRALAIQEKALEPEHPDVAESLHSLANLYLSRGDYAGAEPLFKRTLAIREKVLGPEHPHVALNLYDFTILRLGQGRTDAARQTLRRVLDIQEQNLSLNLAVGSQARNRAYLASLKDAADLAIWLHLDRAKGDPQAARLALAAVLGRKGRVLEEAATATARLRRRLGPRDRESLQRLADAREQLANLVFKESGLPPEQYKAQVATLREQVRQLEDTLAPTGTNLHALTRPVTVEAAQKALPKDAALVEFVLYRPFDPKAARPSERFGPSRYAAYLLRPEGPPVGVDLGEARQLDALVSSWRSWLVDRTSPTDGAVQKLGRELHKRLLGPLGRQLGAHLLIAPDGQLNTLPFAALVEGNGRSLLAGHTLTYLVSGRELPRLGQKAPAPQSGPLVVGGPDFTHAEPGSTIASQPNPALVSAGGDGPERVGAEGMRPVDNPRSPDLAGFTVRSLPGAAIEAKAVANLLGNARLLTGPQATENALKAARSPLLLHLATHGFFLADKSAPQFGQAGEEPLLRSGVALAGFNARASGTEDGVLTALEAQGLELDGTRMVVLSACDTGAGPVVGGEGVQGLRRSLALAGAQSQVLALWPVGDRTTARLMEQFYRGLAAGLGRSEALRRAQLGVAAVAGLDHPYWWAAFALSGNWRPVTFSTRSR